MPPPDRCLWSAWPRLIVDGEQMKEISRDFMGIAIMAWNAWTLLLAAKIASEHFENKPISYYIHTKIILTGGCWKTAQTKVLLL